MRLGASLPIYNTSLAKLPAMGRLAEDAGFESLWAPEYFSNPFVALGPVGAATSQITLATGLAAALTRSPFAMANAAADVDELTGGRFILGLGTGDPMLLQLLYDAGFDQPVGRMREYIAALRAAWEALGCGSSASYEGGFLGGGSPSSFGGEFYRLTIPQGVNRLMARSSIPVFLGAQRPRMMRLAGELADGLLGYFYTPHLLRSIVLPSLEVGARRAGRNRSAIDVASFTVASVSHDRSEAIRRARIQVGFYAFHPTSDAVMAAHGLEKEQVQLREAFFTEGPPAFEHTDDRLVETFSIAGTPDECRRQLRAYEDTLPLAILHTPYADPLTGEESEDAFRAIVDTWGA